MMRSILLFTILFSCFSIQAQRTVGLLSYSPNDSYDGYNLMYPHNQSSVFLLDNCGEIVHTWTDDADFRPGNTAYLLEDGRIVKTKRPASVTGNPIWAGGGGGTVEILDWDNTLEWTFTINNELERLHHDIEVLPNGNILMIVWELVSREDAIAAGRDTTLINQDELWPDYLLEINPTTNERVWEWHAWDHLIQDFDPTKANFGVVADHPEKINLNWDTNAGKADWLHSNALDYRFDGEQNIDQILLSVPQFNEVWVIDHSTTTEQAAGSTGGIGARGGDLLYRWGNPAAYNQGDSTDQTLFYQHDAHWAEDFIDNMNPNFGKFIAFNNRVGADFSNVVIWENTWDMYSSNFPMDEDIFLPFNVTQSIGHPDPQALYSTGLSSAQILPNGNYLICSGRFGYSFELTPTNDIVWEYITPLLAGQPVIQGDSLSINNNLTFRMKRYPTDYAAFDGRDLSSKGWIELNPDSTYCDVVLTTNNVQQQHDLKVYPNPTTGEITIEWENAQYAEFEIYDILGRLQKKISGMGGRKYYSVDFLESGVYFIKINQADLIKIVVQ